MEFIAHRGNLSGPNPDRENSPAYIDEAIAQDYSVEIDLRYDDGVYLGHDTAQYPVSVDWLSNRKSHLWVHCKDRIAFDVALKLNLHCFWHDTDDYTMTSLGYVWAYPGKMPVGYKTVIVMPERHINIEQVNLDKCYGVCSDYIMNIKNL